MLTQTIKALSIHINESSIIPEKYLKFKNFDGNMIYISVRNFGKRRFALTSAPIGVPSTTGPAPPYLNPLNRLHTEQNGLTIKERINNNNENIIIFKLGMLDFSRNVHVEVELFVSGSQLNQVYIDLRSLMCVSKWDYEPCNDILSPRPSKLGTVNSVRNEPSFCPNSVPTEPRIRDSSLPLKIELENLNSATDEINKLEIELEEANSTFRILLNESTRRLKLSTKKLGSCIEKARPYYEALNKARAAQIECQKAAVKFRTANGIHAAAKEMVTVAEQRFMSNSHEWQFDNAWQEMLNHATQKVMDAEKQKTECHAEHQRRTLIFHAAEQKVQQLEERFRRSINKSRPYFEEKQICQDQLQTQKNRIEELQQQVQMAKQTYATALRNLERISDDIHRQRGDYPQLLNTPPPGPREPGVGAELNSPTITDMPSLPDFQMELEKCGYPSITGSQISISGQSQKSSDIASCSSTCNVKTHKNAPLALLTNNQDSENDEDDVVIIKTQRCRESPEYMLEEQTNDYADSTELSSAIVDERDLEALRQKVKFLAVRPIEGGDGQQEQNDVWEHELNATVDKLDHLLLLKECAKQQQQIKQNKLRTCSMRPDSLGAETINKANMVNNSLPITPEHLEQQQPLKKLQKIEPLPAVNVSMRELPLLARLSNEILDQQRIGSKQRRRSLN
uniref:Uncharacterized protein n=1 Tax=Glossina brevipalpis TaxID=37001 RepID=A0A1A9WV55_9MUSC